MTPFILILILGAGPGIFWAIYFYKRDKLEPEPKGLVIRTYFFGALAALPVLVVNVVIMAVLKTDNPLFAAIVVAPIIEELFKFLVVRQTMYTNPEFDEPMDGIVYASAAALGFASIENVLYLYEAAQNNDLMLVAVLRALLSVPGHALFAAFWGYSLGMKKCVPGSKANPIRALFIAMAAHSLFNVFAMGPLMQVAILALGLFIIIPVLWGQANKRMKDALAKSQFNSNAHHTKK